MNTSFTKKTSTVLAVHCAVYCMACGEKKEFKK